MHCLGLPYTKTLFTIYLKFNWMSSILTDNLTRKEMTPQSHRWDFLRPAEGRCTRPCANSKLRLSEAAGVPAHSKSCCFFSLVPKGKHMKQAWTQNKYFLLKVSGVLRLSVATAKNDAYVNLSPCAHYFISPCLSFFISNLLHRVAVKFMQVKPSEKGWDAVRAREVPALSPWGHWFVSTCTLAFVSVLWGQGQARKPG